MDTAFLGVKEFHPDVVHLLYTPATNDVWQPFVAMLTDNVKAVPHLIPPYGIDEITAVCRRIKASLSEGDVLQYNITEGTKIAAASLIRVAYDFMDSTYYFTQEGDKIDLTTGMIRDIESSISNEEFIRLFGNNLASYNTAAEILPVDVVTARDVKLFIESRQRLFQKIQHQYRSQWGGRIEHLPDRFKVEREKNTEVIIDGGALRILEGGKPLFYSDNQLATRLFFTGRWWEVLVSDAVYRWDLARRSDATSSQVWRNVEFNGPERGKTKNELDILVNDRRRLILIECKSGYIAQENIYKIESVRQTYGGEHSLGVLVSYYPLDESLVQKCRDLHLHYHAPARENDRITFLNTLPAFLDEVVKDIRQ